MSFAYFAYGSNMLPARLQARCSTARVIGTAHAYSFGLEFSKPSKDGSGKATLIKSELQEVVTPGVLFEIERSELRNLDRAEGAGYGYDRDDSFRVACASTGATVNAKTYLASTTKPELKPFDWYLALVLAGSHHHALQEDHIRRLRAINHIVDSDHGRKVRIEALQALLQHGYDDHHSLLQEPRV
ncbi:MAG: gamma-glutamylcyclotransferase family protein [Sedimentitalea sp.]|uniref:gamma-glutamylcyclotransferase family protein n=1 Tax=Sedimentitalea sp. TaxID=2048915 RepID=UPI003265D1A2